MMLPDTEKATKKWFKRLEKTKKHWQVKLFLQGLQIPFKEIGKDTLDYNISAPLFGLRFRFGGAEKLSDDGWKVIFLDEKKLVETPNYFCEDVMWYLIEMGYFSFIRDISENKYRTLLITQKWAHKIIDRRLEFYGQKPIYTFKRIKNTELRKMPLPRLLSLFPGFFDYLY